MDACPLNRVKTAVGFVDAIKRWRLARQGLSSGKKRRVHSENPVVQALEDSIWVKISLYATFAVASAVLVLKASAGAAFGDDSLKGAVYGFIIAVTAIVMFQVSFVALTVRARVRGFDWTLEQAAQDLGASPLRTFWKVTFPLILPGILAAALLSFALSLDDFIITLFNAGSLVTFPLYINGSFRVKFPPEVNVLASVILIVSVALMLGGTLWGARGRRKSSTA